MKVNLVNNICKSETIKRGLEFAADNGALFAAGTSLVLSTCIRPLSILATPKAEKENKKLACAKSISSSAVGFGILLAASLPVSRGIARINKTPEKYLNSKTISNLSEKSKKLQESKPYQFITQMFKLGLGFFVAAPKSAIVSELTPEINKAFTNKTDNKQKNISFKANVNPISKGMANIMNKPKIQTFAQKFKDTNFPMHIAALTDTVSALTFVHYTNKKKNIEENRKKVLNNNTLISTGLSIAGGYVLDKALKKPTDKFIKKFSEINKNSPKLAKYVEGIKIAKPTLILGLTYYAVIPLVSTFLAERVRSKK